MAKKKNITYQSAVTELQEIIGQLEEENIGIDELSGKVQRAAELIQFCREKLRSTEIEIKALFKDET